MIALLLFSCYIVKLSCNFTIIDRKDLKKWRLNWTKQTNTTSCLHESIQLYFELGLTHGEIDFYWPSMKSTLACVLWAGYWDTWDCTVGRVNQLMCVVLHWTGRSGGLFWKTITLQSDGEHCFILLDGSNSLQDNLNRFHNNKRH